MKAARARGRPVVPDPSGRSDRAELGTPEHQALPVSPIPDAELVGLSLTATPAGLLSVKVSCPATETLCTGTISLKSAAAVAARAPKAAILALASAPFKVAGGKSALVTLHLSARARVWLARVHSAHAKATIAGRDPAGATSHRRADRDDQAVEGPQALSAPRERRQCPARLPCRSAAAGS